MEKHASSTPSEKWLLIERDDKNYTPAAEIPDEYLHLLMPYAGAYFYRDEDCDMLTQHIKVSEFSILGHDIFARKYFILRPYTSRHILALHYMHDDSIHAVIDQMGPFRLSEKEVNLFSLHADFHSAVLDTGQRITSFHINLQPDTLPALAEKFPGLLPLTLHATDHLNGPVNKQPYRINVIGSLLLRRLLSCRYVEVQAECYLYRCCVDLYLQFAMQYAQSLQLPVHLPDSHIALANRVQDFIQHNVQERLTSTALAEHFGAPEVVLQTAFEQVFAIPVNDFILQQKMMAAYDLLLQTRSSLNNIAYRTGYRNRLALTRDFEKYYGYDPIFIRNAQ
ncbi:MAG TPA: AraC family transcriptional regulator [Chitinophaga sp.]|uniref:helix-turn-helix transcriptional regulator n=1 Tax=Chitinophaga sp. TaxID=1869181 RepID=UPI002DBAB985|nr:AraC family transcriptional regulator [Chitinophaga sp.]HEU4551690.1 AraC family transcriptional regulator [Chitinophaga sp.]